MSRLKNIFFLFFLSSAMPVAIGAKLPTPPAGERKVVPERRRMEQIYFFCEGKKRLLLGETNDAAYCFEKAIKADPYCDACYYELSNIYALANRPVEARQLAKAAYMLDSANVWYTLHLAQLCADAGADARYFFKKTIAQNPQIAEAYYGLLTLYDAQGLYEEAEQLLMQHRQKFGTSEANVLSMQNILFKQGKIGEAIAEVKRLTALHPDVQQYRLLLAELYGAAKSDSLAFEAILQAKELDSTSYELQVTLSDYYRRTSNFNGYFRSLLLLFSSEATPALQKLQVLAFLQRFPSVEHDYTATIDSLYALARAVYSYRQEELYATYLLQTGRLEYALNVLKLITLRGENDESLRDVILNGQKSRFFSTYAGESIAFYEVWQLYLDLLISRQEWDLLLHEADGYARVLPDKYRAFFVKGISYFQQKNYPDALNAFLQAKKHHAAPADTAFLVKLYSSLGDAYFFLKKYAKSDKYFDMALRLDAASYSVMNNHAYYLSLSNRKLKKALKLSKATIDAEPNNPTYLDTYAWILYCMGKYADSKQIFRQALVKGGDKEPVMLEHYGDVLYKLKEYSNALIYWQRVVESGGDSPQLQEKISKVKQ
ncbi:MAG: tetratricopeptide repeat protein [Prevotellaceae bacterium]|nr:tetratricopeptide repeat protein [Prevotellaceae bacterium]